MLLFALLACDPGTGNADDVCAATFTLDDPDPDTRTTSFLAPGSDDALDLHLQLRWPDLPDDGAEWPVVVVIHGAWDVAGTPVDNSMAHPAIAAGLVAVHLDLPGGAFTEGIDDRRGSDARAAVAAALRYAGGSVTDDAGCTIKTRTRHADPETLLLMGLSNGGNLAVATLADTTLDIPDVGGLVTWETPAAAAAVNVEFGSDPSAYTAGICMFDQRIKCDIPDQLLGIDADGAPCYDLDEDGTCGDTDVHVRGVLDPASDRHILSPELSIAIHSGETANYVSAADAETFWATRDAGHQAAAMIAAHPDIAILLVASEEDHVLSWPDHPHVFGLGEALQAAGARWTRLNPGREWLEAATRENPPNAHLTIADGGGELLPEKQENPLPDTLAAAARELGERLQNDDW